MLKRMFNSRIVFGPLNIELKENKKESIVKIWEVNELL